MENNPQLQVVKESIENGIVGMFASRDTTDEAYDYALSLFPKEQHSSVAIGIMVYHNTLMKRLVELIEALQTQTSENTDESKH